MVQDRRLKDTIEIHFEASVNPSKKSEVMAIQNKRLSRRLIVGRHKIDRNGEPRNRITYLK